MTEYNRDITIFAKANFRNRETKFGIKTDDRRRHMYIIGKTGVGKTELLKTMIISDMRRGQGLALIDPHGDVAQSVLDFVPESRIKDVIYFNPADMNYPIAFNPLESISPEHHHLVANGILEIFKKIWPDVWSARMEYILNNSLMALLEYPGSTLLEIMRLLGDDAFREKVISQVTDPIVKSFWTGEYANYNAKYQTEAIAPIQNKVGQFLTNPIIRNIIGQKKSSFDIRKLMDEEKILIVNLSKGMIGETNAALLGAMMVTKIEQAAMSRADIAERDRKDFFLYADEFQTFVTESFANILSEARKYRLSMIIAHQYISQLPDEVRDAIFGNMGTFIVFRIGAEDAEWLEKEMAPEFEANDLVNLPKYSIYVKLMIDGISSKAFSADTLPPLPKSEETNVKGAIIENIRKNYSTPKEEVVKKITEEWAESEKSQEGKAKSSKKGEKKSPFSDNCWACGNEVGLNFQPDGKRPIYCKPCLEKVQEGKIPRATKPFITQEPKKEIEIEVEKKEEKIVAQSEGDRKGEERIKTDRRETERRGERVLPVRKPIDFKRATKIVRDKPELPKKPGVNLDDLRKSLQLSLGKMEIKNKEEIKKEPIKKDDEIKPLEILGQ